MFEPNWLVGRFDSEIVLLLKSERRRENHGEIRENAEASDPKFQDVKVLKPERWARGDSDGEEMKHVRLRL